MTISNLFYMGMFYIIISIIIAIGSCICYTNDVECMHHCYLGRIILPLGLVMVGVGMMGFGLLIKNGKTN